MARENWWSKSAPQSLTATREQKRGREESCRALSAAGGVLVVWLSRTTEKHRGVPSVAAGAASRAGISGDRSDAAWG
ncbi:hypothetical protein NDU88_001952 [Pleurodeles waltl]|uniref:Uncharacterized protein n=1 Tax=Pleurodeles waltl TaxID=8319 RepID=A0AAV7LB95_PLEWA|nr:hypothetical protein NDU88_001952 [Pleurodeles waltl]